MRAVERARKAASRARLRTVAAGRGPAMTLDVHPAGIPTDQPEPGPPVDPRPAWERIAYTWLAREVDAGQPVDPATLACEVSVAPELARDLLRVLRAQRARDPGLSELRARLVRDRITDAYLRRELHSDQRLDPAELAAEADTTTTVARQWLGSLRNHERDRGVLVEPLSHGRPTPQQLAGLQAHFVAGGHQQAAVTGRPADPSGWRPRSSATTGPGEVRGRERCSRGSLRGSWAATSGRSASSSPTCAPDLRPLMSELSSSGTTSSRTRAPGRSGPASSPTT
jgi:hypothetical protein